MIPRRRRSSLGVVGPRERSSSAACLSDLLSTLAFNHIRTAGTPEGDAYLTLFKSLYEPDYVTLAEEYPGFAALFTPMPRWDSLLPVFILLKAGFGVGTTGLTPFQTQQMVYLRVGLPLTSDESKRAWYQRLMAYPQIAFSGIGTLPSPGVGASFDAIALANVRAILTRAESACRTFGATLLGPPPVGVITPGTTETPPVLLTPPVAVPLGVTATKKSDVGPFMVGAALAFLISRFF